MSIAEENPTSATTKRKAKDASHPDEKISFPSSSQRKAGTQEKISRVSPPYVSSVLALSILRPRKYCQSSWERDQLASPEKDWGD
jgi:hypothetical protein